MKILLTGKNGQLGFELRRSLAPLGQIVAVDHAECDLAGLERAAGYLQCSVERCRDLLDQDALRPTLLAVVPTVIAHTDNTISKYPT